MAKLHEIYKDTVVPELFKQFGYTSVMQVPRIVKITLNMGVGEAVADKKVLDTVGDARGNLEYALAKQMEARGELNDILARIKLLNEEIILTKGRKSDLLTATIPLNALKLRLKKFKYNIFKEIKQ